MAETNFRGPLYSMGALEDNRVESMDGPALFYQGYGIPDLRFSPTRKDGLYPGRVPSHLISGTLMAVDQIPGAVTTTGLAAAANAVSGTAMTLVTVSPGGAAGGGTSLASSVPIIPLGSASTVLVTCMDFGFTTGTLNGTATVTVPDSTLFRVGDWIMIGGGANTAKTLPLITQVQTLASATTITVSPAPAATLTRAPIGNMNSQGAIPPTPPNAAAPYIHRGLGTFLNPLETLARCVSITSADGAAAGGAFKVTGYDVYGAAMTETLTHAGAATTIFGQKAFRYIAAVTPQFSDAHQYSAGWGDTFGFPWRADRYESTSIMWGGKDPVISTGFLGAVLTSPATATTGDVRGTVQVSTNGNGSALAAPVAAASNGTLRLTLFQNIPPINLLYATPLNTVPLYGVSQF